MVFLSQVALSWKSTPELEPNSCSTNFAGAVCASVALRGEPRRLGSGQTESRTAIDAAPRWFYARQSPGRLNAAYRMCWAEATAASGHSPGGGFSNLPHVLSTLLFWGTPIRRRNLSARAGYQQKASPVSNNLSLAILRPSRTLLAKRPRTVCSIRDACPRRSPTFYPTRCP